MCLRRISLLGAVALMMLASVSCRGRRADGTPNGETVEVVIGNAPAETDTMTAAPDTLSDNGAVTVAAS